MLPRCGLITFALLASTAVVSAERLPIQTYTNLDGLAHTRVTCVFSDSRGFVWFCTADGLSRFDGQGFTTYGIRDGLATARINDFIEAADGTYWVATNGDGVYQFTPLTIGRLAPREPDGGTAHTGRFARMPVGDSLQTARVNVIRQDRTGRLWAGTDGGLFCLDRRDRSPVFRRVELGIHGRPDPSVHVWAIAEDDSGSIWLGTSWGLVGRLSGKRTVHATIHPSQGADHVRALLVDRDGRVWAGHDAGVAVFRPAGGLTGLTRAVRRQSAIPISYGTMAFSAGDAVWLTAEDSLTPGIVRAFEQSSDGHVWIATTDGLTEFDGQRFRKFTDANGIGRPTKVAEDREGNIWIGTFSGAQRFARSGFRSYTNADGLADPIVRTIVSDAEGQLHFVSQNQHIHRFDGSRFTSVRPNLWHDESEIKAAGWAILNRSGEWWIPGGAGLYRFPRVTRLDQLARVRPRLYTSRDGLAGEDVMSLFEDSRGDMWIGRRIATSLTLTRWEQSTDTFHRYGEADGLPAYSRIMSFAEDRAGNVWMGLQNGGVARYRRGRFRVFTSSDGAAAGPVVALRIDTRGRLWMGAQGPPLSRVDNPDADHPRFVPYTPAQRLSGDAVGCIVEDRKGRLYLCNLGAPLDLLDPETGEVRHFTAAHGLIGADLLGGYQDRRGDLWFGSYNGLLRLLPGDEPSKMAPAIRIAAVRVAGESYLTSDLGEPSVRAFDLESKQNRIQIEFFALGAVPSTGLRYQYRLDGTDRDWNAPTNRRDVDYGSLSPGRYRFMVRALGPDGTSSPEPATVEFTILRPVWQRWWFQASVAGTFVLMAFAAHRVRVKQLLALQQVRIRIAADLHDDVGGSLSRIAIQSEVASREAARRGGQPLGHLSDIAQSARGLVDDLGDVVWSVDPRHDDLASVFRRLREYADDVVTGAGARWRFASSGDLEHVRLAPQARRHLFLLLKEALTNVARHAAARSVSLEIAATSRQLRVELRDDGRGFNVDQMSDPEQSGRRGLAGMQRRARELNGSLSVDSICGQGTTLRLLMPMPRRWRRMIMLLRTRLRWRTIRHRR